MEMISDVKRCFEWKNMYFANYVTDKEVMGLCSSKGVQLEEAVCIFLMTLGYGVGNRMIQERFQRSGEIVSRQFGIVLEKMIDLALQEIRPLDNYDEVPLYIRSNSKYWPYFKDCIGAIDGTHVRASLPTNEQIPYIGRKGYPTQNIMVVCTFDMLFTFVWPGWEGTAHDTHKYYLVDAGYPNMKCYLALYKGERYHLPDFRRVVVNLEALEKFLIMHITHYEVLLNVAFGYGNCDGEYYSICQILILISK
ncbi:uncharacterized protein LOC111367135 isoform X2 [Olea europaea var. sylvestris]|uniref:uncharacterized protein LOC111367135 isoform X2 n=1 Tax=Olea europaea var. sylvestris TaxID=158386 RepID=UPI000C1D16E8|nr:uncharacterized protein LOC111367135 isoform X2 [Olea europaea var. sylvestris]